MLWHNLGLIAFWFNNITIVAVLVVQALDVWSTNAALKIPGNYESKAASLWAMKYFGAFWWVEKMPVLALMAAEVWIAITWPVWACLFIAANIYLIAYYQPIVAKNWELAGRGR